MIDGPPPCLLASDIQEPEQQQHSSSPCLGVPLVETWAAGMAQEDKPGQVVKRRCWLTFRHLLLLLGRGRGTAPPLPFSCFPRKKGAGRGIAAPEEVHQEPFTSRVCPPITTTSPLRPQHLVPASTFFSPSGAAPALHHLPPWGSMWKSGGRTAPVPLLRSSSRCLKVSRNLLLAACPDLPPWAAPAAQVSTDGMPSRTPPLLSPQFPDLLTRDAAQPRCAGKGRVPCCFQSVF